MELVIVMEGPRCTVVSAPDSSVIDINSIASFTLEYMSINYTRYEFIHMM